MNKIFAFSAACATLVAATSCGGGDKNEVVAPVEEATVYSDVNNFDTNGEATGKEVTNYGAQGQIVSVEKYMVDKASKQMYKNEHVIYQNGKPAYSNLLNASGAVEGHDIFTYNDKGVVVEELIEEYNEGLQRIAPASRYVYTYDANGDVTSIKEEKSAPKGWETAYEWTYTYDKEGRLTGRQDFTGFGQDRKQSCSYMWSYVDGTNQVKQLDYFRFDLKQQKLKHDSKTHYEYNAAGQVTKATVIRHKNNAKRDDINSRLFTYEYNEAGQLTLVYEQKWNNGTSSWYEVTNTTYTYDAAGQLVQKQNIRSTNKGMKFYNEVITPGAPADKPNVAPAAPGFVVKPVINLEDKQLTSLEED